MATDSPPERTGFAGLSTEVSDVERDIRAASRARPHSPSKPSADSHGKGSAKEVPGGRTPQQVRVLGAALAGLVLAAFYFSSTRPVPTTPTPPPDSDIYRIAPPTAASRPAPRPAPTPSVPPEEKPPIGADLVHGPGELRYCLSEDVRLEAARAAVDDNAGVARFNKMIADFNARCSHYKYKEDELAAAQRQVALDTPALQVEGRGRFAQ